jgi:hypothetical protein
MTAIVIFPLSAGDDELHAEIRKANAATHSADTFTRAPSVLRN